MYRRVSKEGLITQAPFLRLPSMWKMKERMREREREKERIKCECICVREQGKKRETEREYRGSTQYFFGSLLLITFQTSSCRAFILRYMPSIFNVLRTKRGRRIRALN